RGSRRVARVKAGKPGTLRSGAGRRENRSRKLNWTTPAGGTHAPDRLGGLTRADWAEASCPAAGAAMARRQTANSGEHRYMKIPVTVSQLAHDAPGSLQCLGAGVRIVRE